MKASYNKIYNQNQIVKDFIESMETYGLHNEISFRHCKATTAETGDGEFIALKSYGIIVAIIDNITKEGVDILRTEYGYTATSAQHIAKFFKEYKAEKIFRTYSDEKGRYYIRIK